MKWKRERDPYNFEDRVIKLDTNISGGTDLDPTLANGFPVFGS